jgi:hypothetical protein
MDKNKLKKLIKEVLSNPTKKDSCNCGCDSCESVGNEGVVLNESLVAKSTLSPDLQYHVDNKLPLLENTFRYGSTAFLNLWSEARKLYSRNMIHVNDTDKAILAETNLGEYGMYEGKKVPLDLPMLEENKLSYKDLKSGSIYRYDIEIQQGPMKGKKFITDNEFVKDDGSNLIFKIIKIHTPETAKYLDKKVGDIIRTGEGAIPIDFSNPLNEAESKDKNPPIGKPKRGGSKKFYVYVRDKGKIKKVSFGDTSGLSAKINNPKARKAFAARHNCKDKKDRTTPGYWSCNVPKYWKALGGDKNFSGYW